MKTSNLLHTVALGLCMPFLASCVDDTFTDGGNRVVEGLPAQVELRFMAEGNEIYTRASQNELYENLVENIYVFVFDGSGQKKYGGIPTLTYQDPNTRKEGTASFNTNSLNNATIVGVANANNRAGEALTAYQITTDELEQIQSLDELQAKVMSLTSPSVERTARFMMTGYAVDAGGNKVVNIPGSEGGQAAKLQCTLKLQRTDAKVKFIVTPEAADPGWQNFKFTPKDWTVKRVPKQSYVLEHENNEDYSGADAVHFNMSRRMPFEVLPTEQDLTSSFVFYMPENRKQPKQTITADAGDAAAQYALRDAWKNTHENGDKLFTYANDSSTYVEMTGTLSYIDNLGMEVNADVRMTVHLGYVTSKNGTSMPPDPNDYNTLRNGSYTYNVKIRGVDDIIVEVTDKNDRRPGYEGDVVYTNPNGLYEFDSHYDRRLITLNKTDIGPDMKWGVNTHYSRGIHDVTADVSGLESEMRDYRWIKFAVNKLYGVDAAHYVKYPGDQNYNDPFPMQGMPNDEPSPYYNGGEGGNFPDARLMDVNQLILFLQDAKNEDTHGIFDADGNVAITVFVDENVYYYDPTTQAPAEKPLLWKETVDTDDRQLHIISQGSEYSQDGNSSVVNSKYSFKQRSVRTIFNVDQPDDVLPTAWGLESTMETERLYPGDVTNGTTKNNGRVNTLQCILGMDYKTNPIGRKWTDILNTSDHYELNSNYENAVYACMLRNRDLDGDNVVDANEIRWYLAAIDQLTDIFLGDNALDEASRLYPYNQLTPDNPLWHYTSSSSNTENTADNSQNWAEDSWILWAEEGASRGSCRETPWKGSTFAYRCVRNLGLSINNPEGVPTDLVQVTDKGGGAYEIDMGNLNPKARRTIKTSSRLPEHNERDLENRPYAKFEVFAEDRPTPEYSYSWGTAKFQNSHDWNYYQTYDVPEPGWRAPNQRELLIMSTRLPESAWKTYKASNMVGWESSSKTLYICITKFSMNGQGYYSGGNRYGCFFNAKDNRFQLTNNKNDESGYIRPVRDVD